MTRPSACLTLLLLFLAIIVKSQPKFVAKFGRISLEELKMLRYAPDTGAHAVVLFDKARLNGITGTFTRHIRMKILTHSGTSFANFQVNTPSRAVIDGSTFNLAGGQIEETKLAKENIFREEIIDDLDIFKVFFPNVKPGSVVELRYSFTGVPYQWRFQNRIPVMYNEIILEPTNYVYFKKALYGSVPVKALDDMTWAAENVPAFHEETLMADYSNYIAHFKFDILKIHIPSVRGYYREYSTTWGALGKYLSDSKLFGGVIDNAPFLNAKAKELKSGNQPVHDKLNSAYDYIKENIKWNGSSRLFASNDYYQSFLKNHSGNSADVNLLLVTLLLKSGVKAYPVILSTRDNGLLNPASASLSSVNYVAAYVKDGDTEMIMDATSPHLIPGMLPSRCLNTNAYVVDGEKGWWVDLTSGKSFSKKQFISIKFEDNGVVTGSIRNTYEDYDFLDWIEKYQSLGSDEAYVNSLKASTTDLTVNTCVLSVDKDKLSAVETIQADLSGSEYIQKLGNELLITPFVFNDIINPFKSEKRAYPIDFISTKKRSIIISLPIPENYGVQKVPDNLMLRPQHGGAKFTFQSAITNNVLNIRCTFSIDKQLFSESEYSSLRGFFSEVSRKLTESIQLYKKT